MRGLSISCGWTGISSRDRYPSGNGSRTRLPARPHSCSRAGDERPLEGVRCRLRRSGTAWPKRNRKCRSREAVLGAARIQSERRALMLASVAQMQKQAKAGTQACELLEEETAQANRRVQSDGGCHDRGQGKMSRASSSPERTGKTDHAALLQRCFARGCLGIATSRRSPICRDQGAASRQHRWRDIGLLENGGAAGHSEEDVGNLWLELQTFREGLLQEHSRPKIATLDEPEPEAAPESQKARLQDLGKEMKALRERITDCAKQSSPVYDSVALTRFLRATSVRGPASIVSVPSAANFALPVLMDEARPGLSPRGHATLQASSIAGVNELRVSAVCSCRL